MKRNIFYVLSMVILGGAGFFIWRGNAHIRVLPSKKSVSVVASFYPLAYFASEVGGEFVSVHTITPSGAEPHDFEPSPRELASLKNSDLFIYNGASFEPWAEKWEQAQSSSTASGAPATINMISRVKETGENLLYQNNHPDPHIWLDPSIAQKEVFIIRDALMRIDPPHQSTYETNAGILAQKMIALDTHFQETLASCAARNIIVSHDAFEYLGRRYGLSIIPIAGVSPDEEPAPQELMRIISRARNDGIHYVFFEAMANVKFADTVAREIGGELLVLNPLESITPHEVQSGEDYVSLMMMNLRNLQTALVCKQ